MTTVRAKFKVREIAQTIGTRLVKDKEGTAQYESCPLTTIIMAPVYPNGDPDHENTKFWNASPSGEFKLGTINPEAAAAFQLDKEYYIDITEAPTTGK